MAIAKVVSRLICRDRFGSRGDAIALPDTSLKENLQGTSPDHGSSKTAESIPAASAGAASGGNAVKSEERETTASDAALDNDADAGSRETSAVKKFIQVPGVAEPLGRKPDSTRFLYTVEAGSENDLKKSSIGPSPNGTRGARF